MSVFKCRQCGAEAHDGKACAEQLYEMLLSADPQATSDLELAARFALKHPTTYSQDCLKLARQCLSPTPPRSERD